MTPDKIVDAAVIDADRHAGGRVAAARRRFGWLDHLFRAALRYDQADGGRLAAAVTYYAFFAVFALVLLSFAVLGYILDNATVQTTVQGYLNHNLPSLHLRTLRQARHTAGIVGLLVLPLTGLFWVDTLRSAMRAIWRLDEYPGAYWRRQLAMLAALAGLGLLLAVSLSIAAATQAAAHWLLLNAVNADGTALRLALDAVGFLLGMAVNTVLAIALLTGLPRLRMSLRRVLGPALLVAGGLEVLKVLGQLYIQGVQTNPAYQVVAGAVGLLVFLNLLNQLILFAAALTATAAAGRVTDHTARPEHRQLSPEQHIDVALEAFTQALRAEHQQRPRGTSPAVRRLTPEQRAKLAALLDHQADDRAERRSPPP